MAKNPKQDAEAAPPAEKPAEEQTKIVEAKNTVVRDEEGQKLQDWVERVRAEQDADVKKAEVQPIGPTARMMEQTNAEMEAGRRRNKFFEEQQKNRPVPVPDKGEGTNTPVFRPGEHVPGMNSKDLGARPVT